MNTPIYDFLQKYADSETTRLHMPGHKGKIYCDPLAAVYPYDITEIKGADELFSPLGIIKESEKNAAKLYNTKGTFYSAGGSTLCIQTMLALAAKPKTTVIAPRNVHKAFINACVLLDLDVSWVYPSESNDDNTIISYSYSLDDIEKAIKEAEKPACIYITSPDYYGRTADIEGISKLAKKYKLPLLIDNAHGAHLAFLEENIHPITIGADMCCDSAHKTLPVLTGGAYLHINNEKYLPFVKDTMALFGSTSPSYLIMCSLDLCNDYIENQIKEDLSDITKHINALKEKLSPSWSIIKSEPLKLSVLTASDGVDGNALSEHMRKFGIECEYSDESSIVFLFSSLNSSEDTDALFNAFSEFKKPSVKKELWPVIIPRPKKAMSLREATLSENEIIPTEKALGRICGKTKVTCPPGIAVTAGGEVIDEECIVMFKKYSIGEVSVVITHP